jgi:hypothetical protein
VLSGIAKKTGWAATLGLSSVGLGGLAHYVAVDSRRLVFDGHYQYDHPDLRPDAISTKEIKHTPKYGWVRYTRASPLGAFGNKTDRLLISYEVLAQLCTPDIMRLDRELEVAKSAILAAVGRIPSVNYSKYLTLEGQDIMRNTALVAVGKFCHLRNEVANLDFRFSLAATK